jgi:hypothetical protein
VVFTSFTFRDDNGQVENYFLSSAGSLERPSVANFPITGNRDDAASNGRMSTSFTLTSNGQITAVTNTLTGVRLAGFTGAVSIILLDRNRQPIWTSDTQSYGVDGCTLGRVQ